LKTNGIEVCEQPIVRLLHCAARLEGVELADRTLPAAAMFVETQQRPTCNLAQCCGVESDEPFMARTSRKQKTNVPGLFIAGDADGDVEFAIVAAAEGATAAVAINRELQDEDQQLGSPH
jgi:thioredoxin reductase